MKRTIPLVITTLVGAVLIVSYFIPAAQFLGEFAAISFDILAGIAFILGGGNLLKTHLKKISQRQAGWGYSAVTLVSFLTMLIIGLGKLGVPPAPDQQLYGQTLAPLPLDSFPQSQVAAIAGALPVKPNGSLPPPSVRRQVFQQDGNVLFRGWMRPNQKQDLMAFQDQLPWQCLVEQLSEAAQPPESLRGRVAYYADLGMVAFRGIMSPGDRQLLLEMSDNDTWQQAVRRMYQQSHATTEIALAFVPPTVSIPVSLSGVVALDAGAQRLSATGPLSTGQREALARQFPLAKPLAENSRQALLQEIESRGAPLTPAQRTAFDRMLDASWSVQQLQTLLNQAGQARVVDKTACEMLAEMQAGIVDIDPQKVVGTDVRLTDQQTQALERLAADAETDTRLTQLVAELEAGGTFTDQQRSALEAFFDGLPTLGERNGSLGVALLRAGPLTPEQQNYLFAQRRLELDWFRQCDLLFRGSHVVKFPWSGDHGGQGTAFWWMYEYVFKPCTATMFSMLAFYVASAAFRAFRAKNIEAILLLGTAFIILLGRTFAGVWLTSWMPDSLAGLRIENLTVFIMSVFTTAGNRAIMIGIALGIASTSLKVLLSIDRSYLGRE